MYSVPCSRYFSVSFLVTRLFSFFLKKLLFSYSLTYSIDQQPITNQFLGRSLPQAFMFHPLILTMLLNEI